MIGEDPYNYSIIIVKIPTCKTRLRAFDQPSVFTLKIGPVIAPLWRRVSAYYVTQ
jgi:hypothetical protein